MIRALCATLALVLIPTSAANPSTRYKAAYPQVRKVQCSEGSGSAFLTERGWVSVDHVTSLTSCKIDGHPVTAAQDGDLDLSRLDVNDPISAIPLKINCDGFRSGAYVFAIGYAGGFDWQTMTRHFATYKFVSGLRALLGDPVVIPGMSGGPILNEKGEVVGTVNMYSRSFPVSFSQELRGTSLCRH